MTSPLGALAGAALVLTTRDQLAAPWPGHGPLLLGALFVAAVYLLPRGVAGIRPPRLPHPRRRAAAGPPPTPSSPEAGP